MHISNVGTNYNSFTLTNNTINALFGCPILLINEIKKSCVIPPLIFGLDCFHKDHRHNIGIHYILKCIIIELFFKYKKALETTNIAPVIVIYIFTVT